MKYEDVHGQRRIGRPPKYPLRELEVGQSLFYPRNRTGQYFGYGLIDRASAGTGYTYSRRRETNADGVEGEIITRLS